MDVPLELSFRGMPTRPEIESRVRRRVKKLEKFCDHINSCRVAIEVPHRQGSPASGYRVRIDLTVAPGHELVVDKDTSAPDLPNDLVTLLGNAFDAAERQVKELVDRQQGEVKAREEPRALVVRLFSEEGYGFLKTPEGREIYFHQNAVLDGDFQRLTVGTEVRFAESMGEMGPQATTVQIVGKPGARVGEPGEETAATPPAGWR
jgi:cold shock CspA family protein/ribosome-associated translation inhibitor RaiA